MFYSSYGSEKEYSHDDMKVVKDFIEKLEYSIRLTTALYPLQKQIILKLLATIELVLDNNFVGMIGLEDN